MAALVMVDPGDDAKFKGTVRQVVRRSRTHRVLEAELRRAYPRAKVRQSELSGEAGERWYVYRDGMWVGDGTEPVAQVGNQ